MYVFKGMMLHVHSRSWPTQQRQTSSCSLLCSTLHEDLNTVASQGTTLQHIKVSKFIALPDQMILGKGAALRQGMERLAVPQNQFHGPVILPTGLIWFIAQDPVIVDHLRNGVVYNFGHACMCVSLYVCMSVRW